MNVETVIPILGILVGTLIPVAVFIWMYYDAKGKREAIIEIAKYIVGFPPGIIITLSELISFL